MKKREIEKDWQLLYLNWTASIKKFDFYALLNHSGILPYLLINSLKPIPPYCRSLKIASDPLTIHTSPIPSIGNPIVAFRIVYIHVLIIVLYDLSTLLSIGIGLEKIEKWWNRERD